MAESISASNCVTSKTVTPSFIQQLFVEHLHPVFRLGTPLVMGMHNGQSTSDPGVLEAGAQMGGGAQ